MDVDYEDLWKKLRARLADKPWNNDVTWAYRQVEHWMDEFEHGPGYCPKHGQMTGTAGDNCMVCGETLQASE